MNKYINGWTIVLSVLFLFLLCWFGLIQYYGMPYGDTGSASVFGDQFGAVNALFSALALAGVIYTLIQQQQEMKAQRREFMNSRAYTLAYKQVELVNNEYKLAVKTLYQPYPDLNKKIPYTFKVLQRQLVSAYIRQDDSAYSDLTKYGEKHFSCLRVLANSCDLLVRLYRDGMSNNDGNVLFNSLRYNLDKDIWKVCKSLSQCKQRNPEAYELIKPLCHESLERINRFNEIYYEIKKDTDDIDGK